MPKLKNSSLISLGQFADDDYTILLDKEKLIAAKYKEIALQGIRNKLDGLWDIPIFKRKMLPQNYELPPIHPSIYPSKLSPPHHHTPNKPYFKASNQKAIAMVKDMNTILQEQLKK